MKVIPKYVIIQIYYFVKERPGFDKKESLDKFNELINEFNEKGETVKTVDNICYGTFGQKNKLDFSNSPGFNNEIQLIDWLYKELNEKQSL